MGEDCCPGDRDVESLMRRSSLRELAADICPLTTSHVYSTLLLTIFSRFHKNNICKEIFWYHYKVYIFSKDLHRCKHSPIPVNIQGMDIEMVKSHKHLDVHLNNKLHWSDNTNVLCKKGQSRLSAEETQVSGDTWETPVDCYRFCGAVCWGTSFSTAHRKRHNRPVKKVTSVLGLPSRPSRGGWVGVDS